MSFAVYQSTSFFGIYGPLSSPLFPYTTLFRSGGGTKSGYKFTTGNAAPAVSTTVFTIGATPVTTSGVTATGTRDYIVRAHVGIQVKLTASIPLSACRTMAGFVAIGN